MELKQVEGYRDLVRDVESTAIINTNLSAYEAAIKRHKEAEEKKVLLNESVNQINSLKEEVKELKELVKVLLTRDTEDDR
jgi:hypothetical protein|tara:strand:- start:231 stop:470 length:240 start_codon:yes stop_codon:yes gene_type:complete